jgi:hypothetical protein
VDIQERGAIQAVEKLRLLSVQDGLHSRRIIPLSAVSHQLSDRELKAES